MIEGRFHYYFFVFPVGGQRRLSPLGCAKGHTTIFVVNIALVYTSINADNEAAQAASIDCLLSIGKRTVRGRGAQRSGDARVW